MNKNKDFSTTQLSYEERVDEAIEMLKKSGLKLTGRRREIIEIFAENPRYMSARLIHEILTSKHPTMSYNTTYRNIYDFVNIGILESTEYNQEQMFRINCSDTSHHHHHFICTHCGLAIPIDACPLDNVTTDLSKVEVRSHRFDIFGCCEQCLKDECYNDDPENNTINNMTVDQLKK